ncbi:Ribosome-releasing factor [Candidatus Rubidus massiliensis]|nr:MAG: ribosome recycling factor [Chlamydia sp. 32-24]CDZ79796.1 Ribosome-releasing factor [Candidatus Rubidus massiliensis]
MKLPDHVKEEMTSAIEHLKTELKGLRTSRANAGMLDHITVEVYGSNMRLKDLASVTAPDSRTLMITPFDPSVVAAIGKGIEKANLGFSPIVEANRVLLKIPPMDESLRKNIVKQCHKYKEDAKVLVRKARQKGNDTVRKMKSSSEITEDQQKKFEKNIQELTDKFCKEADELAEKKEKDILTI